MKLIFTFIFCIIISSVCICQTPQKMTYTYDALNRLSEVIYPGGDKVTYNYDVLGNRTSVVTAEKCSAITAPIVTGASRNGSGSVTLTASGCSSTYNWYASSTGGSILGSGSSFATPFITSNTTYFVDCSIIGCPNSSSRAPGEAIINTFNIGSYCTSFATQNSDEEILNVTIGNLSNSSTCSTTGQTGSALNRYSDYTYLTPTDIIAGSMVNYSIQVGTCGGNYISAVKVFIDFNQNGSFEDAGETVIVSNPTNGSHIVSGSFTIPSSALPGITFTRVVNMETSTASSIASCSTYGWGETEDYRVNIIVPTPCVQNLNLNTLPISAEEYKSSNEIRINQNVPTGVILNAKNSIILEVGFQVGTNEVFEAKIAGGCDN